MVGSKVKQLTCALAFAVALVVPVSAAPSASEPEKDEKVWAETELQLPAFPEKENLIPFTVGAVRDRQFFVDSKSLSVGSDDVIRYTLVIISDAGAQNISFEGLRCDAGERRYYASGRSDKTWSKARSDQWIKIKGTSNDHHVELYSTYFCANGAPTLRGADDARRVLRQGGQARSAGH